MPASLVTAIMIKCEILANPARRQASARRTKTELETMNRTTVFAIAANLLLAAPLAFACDYPQRANIANGTTATKEEMIASQKSVKEYMAAMDEYLACIEAEEIGAAAKLENPEPTELQQREELLAKKHNAAVEEMEIVAARFNDQVRAYKEQSQ